MSDCQGRDTRLQIKKLEERLRPQDGCTSNESGSEGFYPSRLQRLIFFFILSSSSLLLLGLLLPQWPYHQCLQIFILQLLARL